MLRNVTYADSYSNNRCRPRCLVITPDETSGRVQRIFLHAGRNFGGVVRRRYGISVLPDGILHWPHRPNVSTRLYLYLLLARIRSDGHRSPTLRKFFS